MKNSTFYKVISHLIKKIRNNTKKKSKQINREGESIE